jgi:ribulose-5-phosphate 4-epimerase/fuculose-1-phosphate aldolase
VRGIVDALITYPGTSAVLLGNHGVLAFGPDPAKTAALLTVLEEAAKAGVAAAFVGSAVDFPCGRLRTCGHRWHESADDRSRARRRQRQACMGRSSRHDRECVPA